MKKRIGAVLISFLMILSLLPVTAMAEAGGAGTYFWGGDERK